MPDENPSQSSSNNRNGGLDLDGQQIDIGGDAVGRDKLESAGGHIIHAAAGATVIVGERPASAPEDISPAPGESPFKGLEYFDEADASLFFGRDQLTARLVGQLREQRFLAVVGASGSGKSSLVRAGLIPAIRRDHSRWPIHVITPKAHPLKELAASLTREVESVTATDTLIDDLTANAHSLDLAVDKLLKKNNRDERLLLIVDQFEELFTACKDDDERRAFVDNLLHAVAPDTAGATTVVITLRADFYAHCAQFDLLREALAKQQEFIGAMNAAELRQAIEEPAKRGGWEFEPGLVDLLLRDVGAEPGALPLLSHALLETWKRRRRRTLTLEGYHASGGVRGAIARTADDVFAQLGPEQQVIARNIFLRLTEPGEGTQDMRRRASLSELVQRPENLAVIEGVLKTLADARLVTTEQDGAEVAHEALIREWPRLRAWLDEDREGLRTHRQLTQDVHDWVSLQRDSGALYRGLKLDRVADWLEHRQDELSAVEREFVATSMKVVETERQGEEAHRQKELDDAKKMAEAAEARARAERRSNLSLRVSAGLLLLVIAGLLWPYVAEMIANAQAHGEMVPIPAGTFVFGQPDPQVFTLRSFSLQEWLTQTISLDAYQIDKYPVTNRQYALCVNNAKCAAPIADVEWLSDPEKTNHPVVNVTVRLATEYCQWLGKRLPTEAEWERAVRGQGGRPWPWGTDAPILDRTHMPIRAEDVLTGTVPVDSKPAGGSSEGVYDLIGNVWEWTSSYEQSNRTDYDIQQYWNGLPKDYREERAFVVRGGSWRMAIRRATNAIAYPGAAVGDNLGFRCATSTMP